MRILIYLEIELTAIERELQDRDNKDAAAAKGTPEYHRLKGSIYQHGCGNIDCPSEGNGYREYNGDNLMTKLMAKQEQYGQC